MGYEKVIKSGDFVEHYAYKKGLAKHQTLGRTGGYDQGYRKHFARRSDNFRRSVSNFRRLVRSNCIGDESVALLTLTMLQIVPLATSWKLFTKFFDSVRDYTGRGIRYIAVPEFQERGAVHFHVLVFGLPDHVFLNEGSTGSFKAGERSRKRWAIWLAKNGYSFRQVRNDRTLQNYWRFGYVDLLPTDGSPALAYYLSSYLTPTLSDVRLGGERAYSHSRNVLRPVFAAASEFSSVERERLGISGDSDYYRTFDTEWLGTCEYSAFGMGGDILVDETMFDSIYWP